MPLYKIVRFYENPNKSTHTVRGLTGLYLEEVQKHCKDPESSSKTAVTPAKTKITRKYGNWSEGYEVDNNA